MNTYILRGVVHPERVHISLPSPIKRELINPLTNDICEIKLSIILNQITFWVYSDFEWNIHDLRNVVKEYASTVLSIFGFIRGCAFDIEITHIMNDEKGLEWVYGIEIGCISERNKNIDINQEKIMSLLSKTSGLNGVYINRCFNDLIMAMKHPSDTGFYCYRALEALKQYCKIKFNIEEKNERKQWRKLSEITGYDEDHTKIIQDFAFPARHGHTLPITDSDRVEIFMKTWDVVEAFLEKYQDFH